MSREPPATATLLRAPAALVAGGFVLGLLAGEVARPAIAPPGSSLRWIATALLCAPFLIPTRWFRRAPSVLRIWMLCAAAVASVRAVFMAGWLLPRLPFEAWLTKAALDLLLSASLWLAAYSNRHSAIR